MANNFTLNSKNPNAFQSDGEPFSLPLQLSIGPLLPLWERADLAQFTSVDLLSYWPQPVGESSGVLLPRFASFSMFLLLLLFFTVVLSDGKHVGYFCSPLQILSPPSPSRDVFIFSALIPCTLYPSRVQPFGRKG